ncbi:putative protein [Vanrija pseudolonga]|uniref:Purtative protein n=1 Tax=Vanrija pseudolonga TaxID=143232 RepID=A0AAF0Y5B7_9TREE|nr:purtative protein [Vanrija pseudolonga]
MSSTTAYGIRVPPVRTTSSSTTSTAYSGTYASSRASSTTVPSTVPSSRTSPKRAQPAALPPRKSSATSSAAAGLASASVRSGSSNNNDTDDLDKWGYLYSLRVALLMQRLASPPPSPHIAPSPQSPDNHRLSSAPAGSRMTFNSVRSAESFGDDHSIMNKDTALKKRKSGLGLRLGRKDADLKFPKEFLLEFWGVLAADGGDTGWIQAVRGFLALVKKHGYKTGAGANMREVGTFLDTFSTCLPPPGPHSAPLHSHQMHLLTLLYNSLPTSSYFSGSLSEKERDHLFRLRSEIQSFMRDPEPTDPAAAFTPSLMKNGLNAKANGLGIGTPGLATPGDPSASIKRKPSPQWPGGTPGTQTLGSMVETVGSIWGIHHEVLDRDVAETKRDGEVEKLYLTDLKARLTALSRMPHLTPAQKARHISLSSNLSGLLASFPELAAPASPGAMAKPDPGDYFTPPRKNAVFARMSRRAADLASPKSNELVVQCMEVWEVDNPAEKEREVEHLVQLWTQALDTPAEIERGQALITAVADFCDTVPADNLTGVLAKLHSTLITELSSALGGIFPTTSLPPPAPLPSVLPLLASAPEHFIRAHKSHEALENASNELIGAAVGEYVAAASEMMGGVHSAQVGLRTGVSGKDAVVEGFERVALWIEKEIKNVLKVWGKGLDPYFNPAGLILSKQLPLFLAELQVLETAGGAASDVFVLYEVTDRLLRMWDDLCPGTEHHFDIDQFFEPHVLTWLRETEVNETHQWVSRAVGMDRWIPEGEGRYSQSVTDLFELIRGSSAVVLNDLPLSDYKRAVYLIDLSKTAGVALTEYATAVQALFTAEVAPPKPAAKEASSVPQTQVASKASTWLAKGRHAVQKLDRQIDRGLDRKKADAYIIPGSACVKLTDMKASRSLLEDLAYTLEADETARIVKEKGLQGVSTQPARHCFVISVIRGQNLLTKSSTKAADAFVAVVDRDTGERLFKSRTVLETEDPKWEQSFEISVGARKTLELVAYDRQFVGKHDAIGSRVFKLDPQVFADIPERDVVLPLSPRGVVRLRISMDAGEKHDVNYHLSSAARALDRTASDMTHEIVDRMGAFLSEQLSTSTLKHVTAPLRDKKARKYALDESDITQSLAPVYDYLDENFSVFTANFTKDTRLQVMLVIWRRIIDILISLLVPPLASKESTRTPLGPTEVDIVFKWLNELKAFFNASEGGIEHGIPLSQLQSEAYKDIVMVGQYLDLPTPQLKERAAAAVKAASSIVASPVTAMRNLNLGTNGAASASARSRVDDDNQRMAEVLLRIVRMRPDTGIFLEQQVAALIKGRVERQAGVL